MSNIILNINLIINSRKEVITITCDSSLKVVILAILKKVKPQPRQRSGLDVKIHRSKFHFTG